MEMTKEWLEAIFMKQSRKKSVSKVIQAQMGPAVAAGDNYGSVMTRAVVDVVLGSGKRAKKGLIVKELPPTQLRRAYLSQQGYYVREILVYQNIIPSMEKVMEEIEDSSEPLWAECIQYEPYERLIFEDLSEKGFKMGNKLEGLDIEHSKLAVQGLAKFHALSIVLHERGQIPLTIFGKGIREKNADTIRGFQEQMFTHFVDLSEKTWGTEWESTFAKLRETVVGNVAPLLLDRIKRDERKISVLNHGDCWLNNMLFKYAEESSKPVSLRFVDFQLSSFNSPALDLQYFFNTTPSLEVRKYGRTELLKTYHASLMKNMEKFNCKTAAMTFEQLLEEMERFEFYGLITAVCIQPCLLVENPQDVPDIEEAMKDMQEGKDRLKDLWPLGGKTYVKIMKFVLKDCESRGVF